MNGLEEMAWVGFFSMPIIVKDIADSFSLPADHRIQTALIPRWKQGLKTHFDRLIPQQSPYRRFFTVILTDNLFTAIYLANQTLPQFQMWRMAFALIYLVQTAFYAYGVDMFRKVLALSLTNVIKDPILNFIRPSDGHIIPVAANSPANPAH